MRQFRAEYYKDMRRLEDQVGVFMRDEKGTSYIFRPVKIEPGTFVEEPTVADHWDGIEVRAFFQAIVNEAFKLGIVPEQLPDYSGELVATKRHLEDMRLLAGVKPKVKKET